MTAQANEKFTALVKQGLAQELQREGLQRISL
jgi:hypothetical protein